jgi:hypothetical protein
MDNTIPAWSPESRERATILEIVGQILSELNIPPVTGLQLFRSAINRENWEIIKVDFFSYFHANMGFDDTEYERWYIIEWNGWNLFFSYQPTKFKWNFTHAYNLTELSEKQRWKILPLMWAIKQIEALRKTRKWITDGSYEERVQAALNA